MLKLSPRNPHLLLVFAWTASVKLIQLASLLMVEPSCFADVTVAIVGPWRLYSKSEWHPMAFHPQYVYRRPVRKSENVFHFQYVLASFDGQLDYEHVLASCDGQPGTFCGMEGHVPFCESDEVLL